MKFLRFKPRLIPTIFTVPALILLFSLSFWQFQRLNWKQNIINEIVVQNNLPSIELPAHVDLVEMLYRKVKLRGHFIHNKEMHLYGGSRQFKGENGYYIFTPLKLDDGRIIVVNRGWVTEKKKEAKLRPETITAKEVEIEGSIMESEARPLYVHDNQLDNNLWFYIDLNQMKEFLKEPIENFYVLAKEVPGTSPRGKNLSPNLRNDHLAYALTWLFSAFALIIIYIVYHQKDIEKK